MNNPRSSPVLRAKTPTFAHHGVAFSPFFDDRLALASGANFGLVGNGRLHVLQLAPGGLRVVKWSVSLPAAQLSLKAEQVRHARLRVRCSLERGT